jgi:hypothetical protein
LVAEFFQAAGSFLGSGAGVLVMFVGFYCGEEVFAAGEGNFGFDFGPEA